MKSVLPPVCVPVDDTGAHLPRRRPSASGKRRGHVTGRAASRENDVMNMCGARVLMRTDRDRAAAAYN